MRHVRVGGVEIAHRLDGPSGAPWIVCSNSLFTDHRLWDGQVATLADRYRILRYDHRGHGATSATAPPYDFDQLSDDLLGLLDVLGIETATVVGISMGGHTIARAASRQPDRFERIVISDSRPWSPVDSSDVWRRRAEMALADGVGALVDDTLQRWFPGSFCRAGHEPFERMRSMMGATSAEGFAGSALAIASYDLRPDYEGLTAPTLYMAGERDGSTPDVLADLAARRAEASFVMIQGAGHIANVEQPAAFNAALEEFLDAAP